MLSTIRIILVRNNFICKFVVLIDSTEELYATCLLHSIIMNLTLKHKYIMHNQDKVFMRRFFGKLVVLFHE